MDINVIGQFISTFGFPIVACGALFWYIVKEQRETRKVLEELKTAIENNTNISREFLSIAKEVRM